MQITVRPNTYIYLCMLLLLIPLPWLMAWLLAISFHEFCHWCAVRLFGARIRSLTVGLGGAVMECDALSYKRALFSVLCGPFGGFLLVLLGRWMPRTAVCSWFLSVYNLLPLMPLDGGRALHLLIGRYQIFYRIEKLALCLLTVGAVYMTFWLRFGIFPLAVMGFLWIKNRNRPCKESICRVQ